MIFLPLKEKVLFSCENSTFLVGVPGFELEIVIFLV